MTSTAGRDQSAGPAPEPSRPGLPQEDASQRLGGPNADGTGRRQARCGVCSDVPEAHCPRPAAYAARWENGDEQDLCVEHAAWVRGHSGDLVVMQSLPADARSAGA